MKMARKGQTYAEYQKQKREQYPIGTVLWKMDRTAHHGKVYWSPKPLSIEQHPERGGFKFNSIPSQGGSSWNNIGVNYFLTRQECLDDWGDDPTIENDIRPAEDQEYPHPAEYGKLTIWCDDPTSTLLIVTGLTRDRYSEAKLRWNTSKYASGFEGFSQYLTLDEIRDQIFKELGKTIIEVRVEDPLRGVIHQTGNQPNNDYWHEQGKTRGYV